MDPLVRLGSALRDAGYVFVTPTPETHRRVLARDSVPLLADRGLQTLRDVFGWSRAFAPEALPSRLTDLLAEAGALQREGALLRSAVRFSTLAAQGRNPGLICVHSAYPTLAADAVFFGPDTYRFAAFLERVERAGKVADVGCGSGAGGLLLASRAESVQLLDINPAALRLARVNAALNGLAANVRASHSDVLSGAEERLDLVVSNPPYLADPQARTYRDGGGALGTALSVRIVREALERLQPGGRLLLYTATPVIEGEHAIWPALAPLLAGTEFDYRELDPDVFGEELEQPGYRAAERIAVIGLDARKR